MGSPANIDDETVAGLRLIRSDGIGPVTYHGLVAKYGSAAKALDLLPQIANQMGRRRPIKVVSVEGVLRELKALDDIGAHLIPITSDLYPKPLAEISDAPPFLTALGNTAHLAKPAIGIVGARNASTNGKKFASLLSRDLSDAGYTIWSGLARGIDTAAHFGALEQSTVAVMAGGADVIYPRENSKLHHDICETGAIVSEMPPGTDPQARHFPRRNRIISGASAGVIVVEGTPKSGSLITARLALDQGRDVFGVPGSPLDPRAEGPNGLIRDGAVLVRSADDVLEELGHVIELIRRDDSAKPISAQLSDINEEIEPGRIRESILAQLGAASVTVDELRRQCQVSAPVLAAMLLELELEGRIERLPGNRIGGLGLI